MERNVEIDKISDGKRYGANDLVKVGCDDCRGCSACCHGMGDSIVLDPMDVYRLEKKLGKTMEEILLAGNVALRVVDGVILPHLKMTEQSDRCSFLNEEGRCSIHDARPGFCRMFPLGRLYEDGTFSYFLQVNECPKENKTKVKVRRWLDTPELGKYEAFTTKWHYYLKEKQNAARESEDDAFRQQISMNILKLFYLLPYDGNTDFYTINEQISNFAQTYPTNLKASSNEALLFMRRYRFANCSCFSCCFKDAYPSSNVQ